jgi:hypothetical protein
MTSTCLCCATAFCNLDEEWWIISIWNLRIWKNRESAFGVKTLLTRKREIEECGQLVAISFREVSQPFLFTYFAVLWEVTFYPIPCSQFVSTKRNIFLCQNQGRFSKIGLCSMLSLSIWGEWMACCQYCVGTRKRDIFLRPQGSGALCSAETRTRVVLYTACLFIYLRPQLLYAYATYYTS